VAVYVGPLGWGRRRRDPDARAAADVRRTDAEGRFRFDALVPGPVSAAVVQASGYVSGRFSRSPFGGADTSWPDVVSGETTEVTAALQRGGTVTGTVRVKEGGQALQGAEVTLEQTDMRARFASLMTGTPTALSGADGGFTLDGVLPGTYRLLVSAAGYSPAGDPQGVQVTMPESGGSVEQALEVTAAGVVTGVVTDPQGEPIAGVRIGLRRGPGQGARRRGMDFLRRMLASAAPPADLSDAQGRFRLESVGTDGSWIVEGHSDEYVGGESKPFQVRPGEVQEVSLQMVPGGALRGRVVDENGRWVPGARVQVGRLPDDLAGVPRLSAWQARRALGATIYSTDEQGRFLATNLQPGRQLVRVSKDGYVTWFKRDVVIETGATHDNYTVALSRGEVLEGVVLDTDGHPVRRASVSATQGPPPGEAQASVANANGEAGSDASGAQANANVEPAVYARTDAQGHFRIENLERGAWNVFVAFAPGVKSWMREHSPAALRRNVSVPAPPLEFRLERAAPASVPRPSGAGRGGR
jgi:protocatechuate 3,4-dioxygenase beta subunit